MRGLWLFLLIALGALMAGCATPPDPTHTLYLVRHAEKVDNSRDPALSPAGERRADALADRLGSAGIEHIHSSDYVRTRDTAAPLAERLNLSVRLYDPRDLPGLANQLLDEPGTHLVVGHSNTTPQLAEALGGEAGPPIVEATEYDRLYVLRRDASGNVTTAVTRYGD